MFFRHVRANSCPMHFLMGVIATYLCMGLLVRERRLRCKETHVLIRNPIRAKNYFFSKQASLNRMVAKVKKGVLEIRKS
jgi:hypothetical protein